MKKKDLPLVLLKELESFVALKSEKFKVVKTENSLMKFIDKDEDSTFFFEIDQYKQNSTGVFQVVMTRSPHNHNKPGIIQTTIDIKDIKPQFDKWLGLIEEYDTTNSFFDDPIVDAYSEEFYAEFDIIDEDARTKPFKTHQILLLDNYLEQLSLGIASHESADNTDEINEITNDIAELRENLTTKEKSWVVKRLSKIWGKIAKQGTTYIKGFLSETTKQVIKQGVTGMINYINDQGPKILE